MVRCWFLPLLKQTVGIKEWQTCTCFDHAIGCITFKINPLWRVQCFYIWLQFGILVPYYKQLYNSSVNPTASRARWLYCCLYSGGTGFESRLGHPVSPVLDHFLGPSREYKKLYHDRFLPRPFLFVVLHHSVFRQLVNWPGDNFFNFSTHKNIDIIFISLVDRSLWCWYFSSQKIVVYWHRLFMRHSEAFEWGIYSFQTSESNGPATQLNIPEDVNSHLWMRNHSGVIMKGMLILKH